MSEPAGPIPVATTPSRTTESGDMPAKEPGAPSAEPAKTKRFGRPRARQARVVIRKVGPWSVLKLSFLFYLCVMAVILGALVILYGVLDALGALDSVTRLIRDLFADQTFEINGDWLFTRGLLIGLAMVVLWSLINVFVAFLYNLISDIVGGVEVTLSERR
ncbi:MAG: DUF3566 domain-containing protein [Candidatus Rokuibacteriota bacterium]